MQEITFKVDGLDLKGNIFYPEKLKDKNPAILFVQGWTGDRKRSFQYADALSKLGYICLLYDNRGHGESEGDIKELSRNDFIKDVLKAYDYLSGLKKIDKDNISAVGSSFGGYLVSILTDKRKVSNLVLRVPADYPNDGFDKPQFTQSGDNPKIIEWRSNARSFHESSALSALNNFVGDVLIIESEKDDLVPHQTIENYKNAAKEKNKLTHIVMKDAPHSIKEGRFRNEVTQILTDWFKAKI